MIPDTNFATKSAKSIKFTKKYIIISIISAILLSSLLSGCSKSKKSSNSDLEKRIAALEQENEEFVDAIYTLSSRIQELEDIIK